MSNLFLYLTLAALACMFWGVLRAWHEYDYGERIWQRLRRAWGDTTATPLEHPIHHTCLRHIQTREELLAESTNCGVQVTAPDEPHDLELRNCIHCGSTFTAGLIPKFNSPHDASHPHD